MSNRKIVIGMVFIVVVNLATLIYVNRQVFCLQQTIKELRGLSIKLPPEFESKFESDLTAVVAGIKTSADNVVASIVPEVKSVIKPKSRLKRPL